MRHCRVPLCGDDATCLVIMSRHIDKWGDVYDRNRHRGEYVLSVSLRRMYIYVDSSVGALVELKHFYFDEFNNTLLAHQPNQE
jgi:hypothetical protein